MLPDERKDQVYRAQGWIAPVVLVDGWIKGVWEYEKKSAAVSVKVELFANSTPALRRGLESEAERLADFWEQPVELEILD